MINCKRSNLLMCHCPDKDCSTCNIEEVESLNQMSPKPRTVGELITILSQYPSDTKLLGITKDNFLTDLITVQGNIYPNYELELDNVMICYWKDK